jgi:hypothetical protein
MALSGIPPRCSLYAASITYVRAGLHILERESELAEPELGPCHPIEVPGIEPWPERFQPVHPLHEPRELPRRQQSLDLLEELPRPTGRAVELHDPRRVHYIVHDIDTEGGRALMEPV